MITIDYHWRGLFDNAELNALHAEGFSHQLLTDDWWTQVNTFSLGWVCARMSSELVGFVNVAWDGGVHAFLLDTVVAEKFRYGGIGVKLVEAAVDQSRRAGCEWMHVDFEDHLKGFYLDRCEFRPTPAGVIPLGG